MPVDGMPMDGPAPLYADLAEGPEGGHARWLQTGDGLRIRAVFWPLPGARGTVLIFPGRTEHAEKYGRTAAALAAHGYASVTLDWRGQGLADRMLTDPAIGHIRHFADYQHDIAALLAALDEGGPRFLLAHSMGGAIGLRALAQGLTVQAAAFSAPMWGLKVARGDHLMMRLARRMGLGGRFAPPPASGPLCYLRDMPFEDNNLTSDSDSWHWMRRHLAAPPEFTIAGPSCAWVAAALDEIRALRALPSPPVPALTGLGTAERVVKPDAITERMARWPGGRLSLIEGARHEILMESPAIRAAFLDDCAAFFDRHA